MNGKNRQIITVFVCVVGAIVAVWLLFRDLSDDGGAAANLRNELRNIEAGQRITKEHADSIEWGLRDSERQTESIRETNQSITKSVKRIEKRNNAAEAIINRDRRLIEESERILESIRKTSEEGTTTKSDTQI